MPCWKDQITAALAALLITLLLMVPTSGAAVILA